MPASENLLMLMKRDISRPKPASPRQQASASQAGVFSRTVLCALAEAVIHPVAHSPASVASASPAASSSVKTSATACSSHVCLRLELPEAENEAAKPRNPAQALSQPLTPATLAAAATPQRVNATSHAGTSSTNPNAAIQTTAKRSSTAPARAIHSRSSVLRGWLKKPVKRVPVRQKPSSRNGTASVKYAGQASAGKTWDSNSQTLLPVPKANSTSASSSQSQWRRTAPENRAGRMPALPAASTVIQQPNCAPPDRIGS